MPLPPLARYLDTRPAPIAAREPIANSANIPLEELAQRMHELPPRHGRVLVAGSDTNQAVLFLRENGRQAEVAEDWTYGGDGRGRLWEPNPFLAKVAEQLVPGHALDLACGTGRDAVALAALGWQVVAVDHLQDALDRGIDLGDRNLSPQEAAAIEWLRLDLGDSSKLAGRYDLITIFWFLDRDLLEVIPTLLKPGGSFVMETFTTVHRERYGKPRTEAFVLQPGELRELTAPLSIRFYEEDWHGDRHSARMWAVRN